MKLIEKLVLIVTVLWFASCATEDKAVETDTPTPSPTETPSPTPTPIASPSPTPSPVALIPAGAITISTEEIGFSPNSTGQKKKITFDLTWVTKEKIKNWKVEFVSGAKTIRSIVGDGTNIKPFVEWGGRDDKGDFVSDGTYQAFFNIEYIDTYLPSKANSSNFVVDITPPQAQINLSQIPFSPIDSNSKLTISIKASSKTAQIDSWSLSIFDPAGHLFSSWNNKWPTKSVDWNGISSAGVKVDSGEDYSTELTVRDSFGNTSNTNSKIPIDILVEKLATGYRILSSRIFFRSYTADYSEVPEELSAQNAERLDKLAAVLRKFPNYKIRVVGHAVVENWDNPEKARIEQEKELIPLSLSRANAIIKAMIDRGLPANIFKAEGVGGADQLVADSDLDNRWRNRRVALFIDK